MNTTSEKLVTFKELQSRLKTSERSLRRWIAEGCIAVVYIGRQLRFEEIEVKRFMSLKRRARVQKRKAS